MSKYLVKILSICAFIVMLPLVILGTALCVTEATDYKVRLFVDGNDSANASCEVLINGEARENNELSLKKNTDVTISIVTTGYDFEAWYKGTKVNYTENKTKVSDKLSYTFAITQNTDLTAKIAVKKYQVTFTGEYDNGQPIEEHSVSYTYGERLEALSAKTDGVAFTGWVIVTNDGVSNTSYETANFDKSGSYTLKPTWSNQKKVSYFNAEQKQFATKIFSQRAFDELTNETLLDSEALNRNTRLGYKFKGWSAQAAATEEIDLTQYQGGNFNVEPINLYMMDELLTYNMTVALEEGNSSTSAMTYDVEHGFSEYTGVNGEYKFVGLKYKNVLYTYNATSKNYANEATLLSDVILADYPHVVPETLNLIAAWKEQERTIIYHNATGAIIANATYSKSEFETVTLPDQTNDIVKNNLTNGFKFAGWSESVYSKDPINLDDYKGLNFSENNLDVYIIQTEVAYTLNVKFNALDDTLTTIKYNVTTKYDKEMAERNYYNFTGLMYNDTLYSYNTQTKEYTNGTTTLSSVIIATSPNADAEVTCTAVWEAQYEKLNFKITAATKEGDDIYAVKENGDLTLFKVNRSLRFADEPQNATTCESKILDVLYRDYVGFCYKTEGDETISVALNEIKYSVGSVEATIVSGFEDMTFATLLYLLEQKSVALANDMTIELVLLFAPIAA